MICSLLKAAVAEGAVRAAKPTDGRPSVIEVPKMQQVPVRYRGCAAEGAPLGAKDLSVVINCDSKLYDETMARCYRWGSICVPSRASLVGGWELMAIASAYRGTRAAAHMPCIAVVLLLNVQWLIPIGLSTAGPGKAAHAAVLQLSAA